MSEILKTTNYSRFKRIASNRPVDPRHVDELVKEIAKENLLHLFPILVNSLYDVIDGQHRLAAAEVLRVEIFYHVDENINKGHIARVNNFSRNWKINDYINYWTKENQPGFDKLSNYLIANPLIPPSTAMKMLDGNNTHTGLKQGAINTDNYEQAVQIADAVKQYRNMIDWAYERYFVIAVMNCFQSKGYDHSEMLRQLETQSRSLVKCVNSRQYTELLQEIYNRNKSRNTLKFKI